MFMAWAFCIYLDSVGVVARMNQYKLQKVHVSRVLIYKQPITY